MAAADHEGMSTLSSVDRGCGAALLVLLGLLDADELYMC
jgi:hypothetical protein